MVAEHVVEHPYYGRDQALAKGWLVLIDAIEAGGDPLAVIQDFVTLEFLDGNNNNVPLTLDGYDRVTE